MARLPLASSRSPALLRATSSVALLVFAFAAGLRETLHSACPMHDGAALAQALAPDAPSGAHHHGAEATGSEEHDAPAPDHEKSHVCDCIGDCAPGATRAPALPTEVATAPAGIPPVVRTVPPLHQSEILRFASSDHLLPPATAPPSSV